jgi:hypothetical protein
MACHAAIAGAGVATEVLHRTDLVARQGGKEVRMGDLETRAHVPIAHIQRHGHTVTSNLGLLEIMGIHHSAG